MKILQKILIIIFIGFIASCDTYPDWKEYVEYSDAFPICGEYYVSDYDPETGNMIDSTYYILYIYNKAYNPTKDSIWIDNRLGHSSTTDYTWKYKIKVKADTNNLSFDVEKAGDIQGSQVNPQDSCVEITISESFIERKAESMTDPTPDSIYFKFTYYDEDGNEVTTRVTKGHRKTGWENPNYDDDM